LQVRGISEQQTQVQILHEHLKCLHILIHYVLQSYE